MHRKRPQVLGASLNRSESGGEPARRTRLSPPQLLANAVITASRGGSHRRDQPPQPWNAQDLLLAWCRGVRRERRRGTAL